jgi:hypothetical protein
MHAQEAGIVCDLSAETSSSFTLFRSESSKNDVHNLRDLPGAWTGVRARLLEKDSAPPAWFLLSPENLVGILNWVVAFVFRNPRPTFGSS